MDNPKKILVIGCTGGIGYSVAETLLREGFAVIGTTHRNSDKASLFKENNNFIETTLDVSDISSIKALHQSLTDEPIFAIINCTGIAKYEGSDLETDIKIWNETIMVNLSSNFYLAKLFYPNLVENGRFIMISSTDSYYGGSITSAYSASKAGVNSLTKSLSLLFKDKKIRVNSIAPGWVNTPMIKGSSSEFYAKIAQVNPLKRIAVPQDISKMVQFLLSDNSDYLNGQVITLDGGYTNQDPTLLLEEDEKS